MTHPHGGLAGQPQVSTSVSGQPVSAGPRTWLPCRPGLWAGTVPPPPRMSALQSLHTGAPSQGSDRGTPGTGSHGRGSGHPTWHWGALRGDTECRPSIPPVTAAPLVRPASHGLSPCWRGIWDSAPPFTAGRRAQGRVGPATRPAGGSWRQVTWAVPRRWAQSPHGCRAQEVHFHFLMARGPGLLSVGRQGSPHPGGVGLWPVPPAQTGPEWGGRASAALGGGRGPRGGHGQSHGL